MGYLYVQQAATELHLDHERLEVHGEDGAVLQSIRLRELEGVLLWGPVQLTTQVLRELLERGIDTTFLSTQGRLAGRLVATEGKNVFARQAQFQRLDDLPFRLAVARQLVGAKIRGARALLLRHGRNHPEAACPEVAADLERALHCLEQATTLDNLRGVEGEAARQYFSVFGRLLRNDAFTFSGRTRRPPKDPVNALLSFGYTLLCNETTGALSGVGLDPAVGILHELAYTRPSLALDLVEEFRQSLIDRLALRLLNLGMVNPEHFEARAPDGVYLNSEGRAILVKAYQELMHTAVQDRKSGQQLTLRELISRQALRLKRAITEGTPYAAVDFTSRWKWGVEWENGRVGEPKNW